MDEILTADQTEKPEALTFNKYRQRLLDEARIGAHNRARVGNSSDIRLEVTPVITAEERAKLEQWHREDPKFSEMVGFDNFATNVSFDEQGHVSKESKEKYLRGMTNDQWQTVIDVAARAKRYQTAFDDRFDLKSEMLELNPLLEQIFAVSFDPAIQKRIKYGLESMLILDAVKPDGTREVVAGSNYAVLGGEAPAGAGIYTWVAKDYVGLGYSRKIHQVSDEAMYVDLKRDPATAEAITKQRGFYRLAEIESDPSRSSLHDLTIARMDQSVRTKLAQGVDYAEVKFPPGYNYTEALYRNDSEDTKEMGGGADCYGLHVTFCRVGPDGSVKREAPKEVPASVVESFIKRMAMLSYDRKPGDLSDAAASKPDPIAEEYRKILGGDPMPNKIAGVLKELRAQRGPLATQNPQQAQQRAKDWEAVMVGIEKKFGADTDLNTVKLRVSGTPANLASEDFTLRDVYESGRVQMPNGTYKMVKSMIAKDLDGATRRRLADYLKEPVKDWDSVLSAPQAARPSLAARSAPAA